MNAHEGRLSEATLTMLGRLAGYPDPDDPDPIGPWGPVIRDVFSPHPQPWRIFGPFPEPWRVAGPFPQPWHPAALAGEYIAFAALLTNLADALPDEAAGSVRRAVTVGIASFVDEYCGNGRWPPRRVPVGPRPRWLPEAPRAVDLVAMGLAFRQAALGLDGGELQGAFADAGEKLVQMGLGT